MHMQGNKVGRLSLGQSQKGNFSSNGLNLEKLLPTENGLVIKGDLPAYGGYFMYPNLETGIVVVAIRECVVADL